MRLGFVIDHSRCIGCHACTVACKSENDVPLGSFRTWVKYTETGEFPAVRRHFAVLRCNQCSAAPCVTICPTRALEKRPDGIVDVQRDSCIGCKSCMQGCPYDALYIHPGSGTAEKCHFCAHRTERGLAPACAVVCPTEAILPGDFDDPDSVVSRLVARGALEARKVEAGTGPNVWYREVDPSGLAPLETSAAGGYLWSNRRPGPELDAELHRSLEERASARTVYDVEHGLHWGRRVSAYLITKAIAAGAFLAVLPSLLGPLAEGGEAPWAAGIGLTFLLVTCALLIADLRRPDRFWLILVRPNWSSWLIRGTVLLLAYGLLLATWLALCLFEVTPGGPGGTALVVLSGISAAGVAGYTGMLFGQARGRVLWMQRGLWLRLIVDACVAGAAFLALLDPLLGPPVQMELVTTVALAALVLHGAFHLLGPKLAPPGRGDEYGQAHDLLARGPFRRAHRDGLVFAAIALLFFAAPGDAAAPWLHAIGGILALYALWRSEDAFVRAGQALPIS